MIRSFACDDTARLFRLEKVRAPPAVGVMLIPSPLYCFCASVPRWSKVGVHCCPVCQFGSRAKLGWLAA